MLYRWCLTVIEPQFLGGTIAWPGAAASSAATAPRATAGTRGVNRRREIIASHNARERRTLRSTFRPETPARIPPAGAPAPIDPGMCLLRSLAHAAALAALAALACSSPAA